MELETLTLPTPTIPPSYIQLLNSPDTKVSDILEQNITFRLFGTGNEKLIDFFVKHIKELLNLTFFFNPETESDLGAKAFAILEHSQPALTFAMLKGQRLHQVACDILSETDPNTLILSRLSSLTLGALCVKPDEVRKTCGFFFQLIGYFFEPSVLALFEAMCSNEPQFAPLQKLLVSVGFPDLIQREIDSFSVADNKVLDYSSRCALNLVGLLRIVSIAASCDVLSHYFTTQAFVSTLNRDIGGLPQFLEDARWETLAALYNRRTLEPMRGLLQAAIELLNNPDKTKRGTKAAVSAIQILTAMIAHDSLLRPFIATAELPTIAVKNILEFPNHSILHSVLSNLIITALTFVDTRQSAISAIPLVLDGLSVNNLTVQATMYIIIGEAAGLGNRDAQAASELKMIPGFMKCISGPLARHNAYLANPYGGTMPFREGAMNVDDAELLAERTLQKRAF